MGCNEKHLRRPTARLKPRALKLVASAQDCKLFAPKLELGSLRLMLSWHVMYASGAILDRFSLTQRDLVGAVGVRVCRACLRYQVAAKHLRHCTERGLDNCLADVTCSLMFFPSFPCSTQKDQEIDISSSSSTLLGAEIDKQREEWRAA